MKSGISLLAPLVLVTLHSLIASAAVLTSDTVIGPAEEAYEGQHIVVSNCTLSVDGFHTFSSLRILGTGVLTHSNSPTGLLPMTTSMTDEPHVLQGTNAVPLAEANSLTESVAVWDLARMTVYSLDSDYVLTEAYGLTSLQRTAASSIPDGATVLVDYLYEGTTNSGIHLAIQGDVEIAPDASINVNGLGYGSGSGPGRGGSSGNPLSGGGGGHGGYGGNSSSNATGGLAYDSLLEPMDKGSCGGFGNFGHGGRGGGAVWLEVEGVLSLNGSITAQGANGVNSRSGGGAGGSILIRAQTIIGTGTISADGGSGEPIHGGGGGGGRIALYFGTTEFSGSATSSGGSGFVPGGAGTIYHQADDLSVAELRVDNGGLLGTNTIVALTNNADLIITHGGRVVPDGVLTLGKLQVGLNGRMVSPGQLQTITVNASNVTIHSGGSINIEAAGYPARSGSGAGATYSTSSSTFGGGGGHAGYGGSSGNTLARGGKPGGYVQWPSAFGNGGGGSLGSTNVGGSGGGALRLNVSGELRVDGTVLANGTSGIAPGGGGGAGGSIWITTGAFFGAGALSANAGNGVLPNGGGGGGGRIAIECTTNVFTGLISAFGGTGTNAGGAGTIYLQELNQPPAVWVDNGMLMGTNTPISLGWPYSLSSKGGAKVQLSSSQTFSSLTVGSNSMVIMASYPSSYVTLYVSNNLIVERTGRIAADGLGAPAGSGIGYGRAVYYTGTNYIGGGGGHGGYGGEGMVLTAGNSYDLATSPREYGSGGGGASVGGSGGGILWLTVSGAAIVDGELSANGTSASGAYGGGGSGGTVRLATAQLHGSGRITAHGGDGYLFGGGGSGGRIAITCTSNLFKGSISASGGSGGGNGASGTIYIKSLAAGGMDRLLLDNGGILSSANTPLDESGNYDLEIYRGAMGRVAKSITVNSLTVGSNAWLSMTTQSLHVNGSATIHTGGGLSADGASASGGSTYGGGGGSHGGFGGMNRPGSGYVYGSVQTPDAEGSGGGNGSGSTYYPFGGPGGGIIRLYVANLLTINGRVSANGSNGDINSGGGSGGSVWITAASLAGNGEVSANGGDGTGVGGGGGGGRIALYYGENFFTGSVSASGGNGFVRGGAGTIYMKGNNAAAGDLLVSNGGIAGTNTPLSVSYNLPTMPFNLRLGGGAVVHFPNSMPLLSNVFIGDGATLTSLSTQTNLELAVLGDLFLASNGSVDLVAKGHPKATGTGAGGTIFGQGAGGGYGGNGGASASGASGGTNYGSAAQPALRGSGGGAGSGPSYGDSAGGGAVRLMVGGSLLMNGQISANGNVGLQDDSGGGAGGSIWVTAGSLSGSGTFSADGGWGDLFGGGGGGGGRIAIYARSNSFAGVMSAFGGLGAAPGCDGTVYSAGLPANPVVLTQSPTGVVSNGVSSVDVVFDAPVNPFTASASDVLLQTPTGLLSGGSITVAAFSPTGLRISFPRQTSVGDYALQFGPQLEDVWGQPMSQVHTGAFSIVLPTIQGKVTDTNGFPIASVLLKPTGEQSTAVTDANGHYSVGVVAGWSGSLTPAVAGSMFVPGSRAFTNVVESLTGQDFLMVPTIAPLMSGGITDTSFWLSWPGLTGVTYQVQSSTNLIHWGSCGEPILGSNAVIQIQAPLDSEDRKFFRLQAIN